MRETVFVDRKLMDYCEYFGKFSCSDKHKLATTWSGMMARCYNKHDKNWDNYGFYGISVHKSWHNPYKFFKDAELLCNWELKLADWNSYMLDKDYYGSMQYGPDTCVWLKSSENSIYTRGNTQVKVIFNGIEKYYVSMSDCARDLGVSISTIRDKLGKGLIPKGILTGYIIEKVNSNILVRYKLEGI